jgi:capsular polysaccharide export protein
MVSPESAIQLTHMAAPQQRLPSRVFAYGFSLNKRRILRRFAGDSTITHVDETKKVPAGATLLLWGSSPVPAGLGQNVQIVRIEDGFLRSVGLGAELVPPVSWVMDRRGIYYDATRASDLEHLLQTTHFSPQLIARAALLRERVVTARITKYCVAGRTWRRPARTERVILVPGQVESDASLRFGAPAIRTNIDLLQAVRTANPDAYLLYKPHPDVVAGIRARGQREQEARAWCDEVITDASMGMLLQQVDEVHVLTSLAGFEALLRSKQVCCYGAPFYAGWGLTRDRLSIQARNRHLTLDELVAAALILYPLYVSRETGGFITPEQAIDELTAWRDADAKRLRPWQPLWRALLRLTVGSK